MTILADFGNLLSHLNIFSKKNHSVSCLICNNNRDNKFTSITHLFYPIPTSSDLILLQNQKQYKIRKLIILNEEKKIFDEFCFQKELKNYLNFHISSNLDDNENIAILVLVINPTYDIDKKKIKSYFKKHQNFTVIICQEKDKDFFLNFTFNLIIYHDYEQTLKFLIHVSMITKQRMRIKDIQTYLPLQYGYIMSKQDENQCLFI